MAMGPGQAASRPIPLPPLLTLDSTIPLVARRDAWSALEQTWEAAATGARRMVLLPGEAGAGKTRLQTEFARAVHARGATVLYGACSAEQYVPYQPFAEALDHLLAAVDAPTVVDALGGDAPELARLVTWRAAELGLPRPAGQGDPDAERARLARAAISVLVMVAQERPLLLVLDDLHWAGRPTVDLLTHIARDQALSNVMILGSYRSTPADTGQALRAALPELRRLPGVSRVPLASLDVHGVSEFVAAAAGHPLGSELRAVVDVLVRQTDGNAFLLVELWSHLVAAGHLRHRDGRWVVAGDLGDIASPEGVREVVDARLDLLDGPARDLLEIAAVIGATFDPRLLAAAAETSVDKAIATLDAAVRARIVGDDGTGRFRFSHELIRRSIYDNLGGAERRRHHRVLADALAGASGSAAEVAIHLLAAVPLVAPTAAIAAAVRAAEVAAAAVAYEDAARFLQAALSVASDGRLDLLLHLAEVTMRGGDVTSAKRYALEAHDLAQRTGEGHRRVEAALAYSEAAWRDVRDCMTAADLLRDVLPLGGDELTQVRVQAALTRVLALAGHDDAATTLGEDALAAARTLEDPAVVRMAIDAISCIQWGPRTLARQLALTREAAAMARAAGDAEAENQAVTKRLYGEITAGELIDARVTAQRNRQLAADSGQPLFRALDLQAAALLAMGEGRFADAERLAAEADALTRNLSGAPSGGFGVQMFSIRREQGRLEEARPVIEMIAGHGRPQSAWRPALAVMFAELGLLDAATAEVRALTADRLAAVPRDALWAGSLSYLADACRIVGDRNAAAAVYAELADWSGLVVQVGYVLAAHGAADRYLGELAALLGDDRAAVRHFEAAIELDARAAMPVWLAHSQLAYGRFLTRRGEEADGERAAVLLDEARTTAERLGLPRIAAEAGRALESVKPTLDLAGMRRGLGGLTEREVAVVRLVARGCSNREIGARLHISQHTAANHVRSILMKTQCANRTEAAAWALRHGLPAGQ
jgi:DNA-binding CsgD family transcriptional regulator